MTSEPTSVDHSASATPRKRAAPEIGKRSLLYLAGNASASAILFLLMPLYTAYLDPSDYGRFDLDIGYIYLAISILYLDMNQVILRFIYLETGIEAKERVIYSALPLLAGASLLYVAAILVLNRFVVFPFLLFVLILGFLNKTVDIYGAACRGLGNHLDFILGDLIYAFGTATCSVVLILGTALRLPALYISAILAFVAQLVYFEVRIGLFRRFRVSKISTKLSAKMLRYASPFVLKLLAYWVLSRYARVSISRNLSVSDNGLYAVAAGVAATLTMVARNFMLAWQEAAFSVSGGELSRGDYFSRATDAFLIILSLVYITLLPLVRLAFPFVFGANYQSAVDYVPPALLAVMLYSFDLFLGHIHANILDNRIVVISTGSGAVLCLTVIGSLVRSIGVNGASLAVCLGYGLSSIIKAVYLNRRIGIRLAPVTFILCIAGISTAMSAAFTKILPLTLASFLPAIPMIVLLLRQRRGRPELE